MGGPKIPKKLYLKSFDNNLYSSASQPIVEAGRALKSLGIINEFNYTTIRVIEDQISTLSFNHFVRTYKQYFPNESGEAFRFAKRFFSEIKVSKDGVIDTPEEFKDLTRVSKEVITDIIQKVVEKSSDIETWLTMEPKLFKQLYRMFYYEGEMLELMQHLDLTPLSDIEVLDHLLSLGKNEDEKYHLVELLEGIYYKQSRYKLNYPETHPLFDPAAITLIENYPTPDVISSSLLVSLVNAADDSEDMREVLFGENRSPIIDAFYQKDERAIGFVCKKLVNYGHPVGMSLTLDILKGNMRNKHVRQHFEDGIDSSYITHYNFVIDVVLNDEIPETIPPSEWDTYLTFKTECERLLKERFTSNDSYSGMIAYNLLNRESNGVIELIERWRAEDPKFKEINYYNVVSFLKEITRIGTIKDRMGDIPINDKLNPEEWVKRLTELSNEGTIIGLTALNHLGRKIALNELKGLPLKTALDHFDYYLNSTSISSAVPSRREDASYKLVGKNIGVILLQMENLLNSYPDRDFASILQAVQSLVKSPSIRQLVRHRYSIGWNLAEILTFFDKQGKHGLRPFHVLKELAIKGPDCGLAWINMLKADTRHQNKGKHFRKRMDAFIEIVSGPSTYLVYRATMRLLYYTINKAVNPNDIRWLKTRLKYMDIRAIDQYITTHDKEAIYLLAELSVLGNRKALDSLLQRFKNGDLNAYKCLLNLNGQKDFKETQRLYNKIIKLYFKTKDPKIRELSYDLIIKGAMLNRNGSWYALLDLAVDDLYQEKMESSLAIQMLVAFDEDVSQERWHAREGFDRSLGAYISGKSPRFYAIDYELIRCLTRLSLDNFKHSFRAIKRFDERLADYIKKINPKRVDITNDKPIIKQNIERLGELRFLTGYVTVLLGEGSNTKMEKGLFVQSAWAYSDYIKERKGEEFKGEQLGPLSFEAAKGKQPSIENLYDEAMMPGVEAEARSQKIRMLVLLSESQPEAKHILEMTLQDCFNNIIHPTPLLDTPLLDQNFLFQTIHEITAAIVETGFSKDLIDSEIEPGLKDIRELHPIHDPWCDSITDIIHNFDK